MAFKKLTDLKQRIEELEEMYQRLCEIDSDKALQFRAQNEFNVGAIHEVLRGSRGRLLDMIKSAEMYLMAQNAMAK